MYTVEELAGVEGRGKLVRGARHHLEQGHGVHSLLDLLEVGGHHDTQGLGHWGRGEADAIQHGHTVHHEPAEGSVERNAGGYGDGLDLQGDM